MPAPNQEGTGVYSQSSRTRLTSSGTSSHESNILSNPFENAKVNGYSHRPNIVPPYVLDTLSPAHYKDKLENTNVNNNQADINPSIKTIHSKHNEDDQYLSFANDSFVKSMNNNWSKFLHSVKQPVPYTKDLVSVDQDFNSDWNLEGSWEGDDRLKLALLGSPSYDEKGSEELAPRGFFGRLFKSKSSKTDKPHDSMKVRSKAGYWMSNERREIVLPTLKRLFVQNPLVPLFLRILIMVFSAVALSLACSIFVFSKRRYEDMKVEQQPSTLMAVVVQCIAIVYVIYIAYDEYSGKPLGLRDPLGKMKLIMLDLLFIILSSANLSLTFNTLYDDEWACKSNNEITIENTGFFYPNVGSICRRQRALAAFLFLILSLWVLTFTLSIVRVVDRVSIGTSRND